MPVLGLWISSDRHGSKIDKALPGLVAACAEPFKNGGGDTTAGRYLYLVAHGPDQARKPLPVLPTEHPVCRHRRCREDHEAMVPIAITCRHT